MNKAAFLDILNHVTSISEQEVIELEKLALNFPYCQSAHLLLAKAAYDRGSMLSNQRLRRAAACAANRQLLKKLINTAGHHLVLEPIADEAPETDRLTTLSADQPEEVLPEESAPTQEPAASPASENVPVASLEPIESESLDVEEYDAALLAPAAEAAKEEENIDTSLSREPAVQEQKVPELEPIQPESLELEALELEALAPAPQQAVAGTPKVPMLEPIELEALELEALPEVLTTHEANSPLQQPEAPAPAAIPAGQVQREALDNTLPEIYRIPELSTDADLAAVAQPGTEQIATGEPLLQQDLPQASQLDFSEDLDDLFRVDFLASVVSALDPVAAFVSSLPALEQEQDVPAIAEEAQSQPEAAPATLPKEAEVPSPAGEEADETLARFDNFLFSPEKEQEEPAAAAQAYQEEILYKVFDANDLGYWMDSSRLGETLLRKNELARAQPYYFRPELLLEYSRHHEMATYQAPEPSILARQFDIIDQFLKLNPKIKSMAQVKIKTESQEDLSLKSTKIRKNTASETLATILVQQGKIKKAIKIYEHLILKLPEKKDYFASQIEKLKTII